MLNLKTLHIFHLGSGNVGKTFLKQLLENRLHYKNDYKIDIKILGIFNSKNGLFKLDGIPFNLLQKKLTLDGFNNLPFKVHNKNLEKYIDQCPLPLVVIDTTSSHETAKILSSSLKKGAFVILSNKKPLSSEQEKFNQLFRFKNRLFFETTVGAGLPIISTVRELLETGDEVLYIKGCFSGTLGYLFTHLQNGEDFSKIISKAKEQGFTEPDPRDDLSGLDVARKILILGRILGNTASLDKIKIQSLYPNELRDVSIQTFLEGIHIIDNTYKRLIEKAKDNGQTLRYVAWTDKKYFKVGIEKVDLNSDIGSLHGPDNLIIIKTKRYNNNPLIIKGPGAGLEVTAAGVLGDLLKIIKIINGYHL